MKTKKFRDYIKTRLSDEEIAEIDRQAALEVMALRSLQKDIVEAMNVLMIEKGVGFNELVRRLNVSPTHISKIKKGEANLTIASIARIFSLLGSEPHLIFNKK
jgi:transcriptional regulator with XRE-family HTH domain